MAINILPYWKLTDLSPAFYDTESGTAIEQTAKVYGAVRELQLDYNEMVTELNEKIKEYEDATSKDNQEFQSEITKIVHDYLKMLDTKIKLQDMEIDEQTKAINESITYIKENLTTSVQTIIEEMKVNDEFNDVVLNTLEDLTNTTLTYKESDESLTLYNPLRPATSYNDVNEELTIINLPEESEV